MKRLLYTCTMYSMFLLSTIPALHAFDSDIDFDNFLNDLDGSQLENLHIDQASRVFSPIDSLEQIINTLRADILLQNDLYKHTNPVVLRPILDFPAFYVDTYPLCTPCWRPSVQPFVHVTWRGNFTQNGQTIASYLDLDNPNLIENLDDLVPDSSDDFDIPAILELFKPLKTQEHRAGIMLGGQKTTECWDFWVKCPVMYLEENLFLTNAERQAIEAADFFDTDEDPIKFARKHLITDKLGIGDTRIRCGYRAINRPYSSLFVGGEVTFPTALTFASGLYGTHFSKTQPAPNFNIFSNLELIFRENPNLTQVQQNAETFLLAAIDRLTTILIDNKLGNGGHLGVAGYMRGDMEVTDSFSFSHYTALEYLAPCTEPRFYIKKKNQADFVNRDYENPGLADDNLGFIEQQITETLFPTMYYTRVQPGLVFKSGFWMNLDIKYLDFSLGYDLWWQGQETLGTIDAPQSTVSQLRKENARKPRALQNKVFGGINYIHVREDHEWCLGLFADITFLQFGIANDLTISIKYEMSI